MVAMSADALDALAYDIIFSVPGRTFGTYVDIMVEAAKDRFDYSLSQDEASEYIQKAQRVY